MSARRPRATSVVAIAAYAAFTVVAFLPVLRDLDGRIVGSNDLDDTTYLWALQWLVHALGHGQNPFVTDLQFATTGGLNATSFTSIFFPAVLTAPITATAGPLVSFNLLMILSPFVAATATFLLLRRIASAAGSFLGGLVYGFSTFMAVQLLGHLNLVTATAMLPVILLVALGGRPDARPWARLLRGAVVGVLVAGLLHTSSELLMTSAIAAAITVGLASVVGVRVHPIIWCRHRRSMLASAVLTAVVLSLPFAYHFVRGPEVYRGVHQPSGEYQTDLAQVVVPFDVNLFAPAGDVTRPVSGKNADAQARGEIEPYAIPWTGNEGEWAGYLGMPLLALVTVTAWRRRRLPAAARLAGLALVVAVVASLGTTLHVQGADTGVLLPWALFDKLPVVRSALPARLMVFAFLAAAGLVAVSFDAVREPDRSLREPASWLAPGNRIRLLVVVAALALLPAVPLTWRSFPGYSGVAAFATVEGCAGDRSAVLFLPFDQPSRALGVQALGDRNDAGHEFDFRLARGLGYRASSGAFGPRLLVDGPFLREPQALADDQLAAAAAELDALAVTCVVVPVASATASAAGVDAISELAGTGPVTAGDFMLWPAPPDGWSP